MKRVLSLVLVLALCAAIIPVASAATHVQAWVVTSNKGVLNLRKTPFAPANNLVTRIPYGASVIITSYVDDNWVTLLYTANGKDYSGYASRRYVSTTKPGDAPVNPTAAPAESSINYASFKYVDPYLVTVKASHAGGYVNMRWAPSKSVRVMDKIYDGTQLTVIAVGKNWCQVMDNDGHVGFMMTSFLSKVLLN